ncbi:Rep family protein [Nesterenkonia lutea]|uniref:Plasmid replication protein origin binding domain-containing protein n=1 Tax=Nesterenkonia lutea TaxID=272919 RepID=A0ABR9JEN0_9MICC|nr:Rep family protein [Nesterenkonia lutea]MBE1524291.1 hypothetical protein [Nesterenkonia lutea]
MSPTVADTRSTRFSESEHSFPVQTDDSKDASTALPEALQLLDLVGTDEDPYAEGGKWAYAKDHGGTCFFITNNEKHDSGRTLLTEETIEKALGRKGMTKWAWIKHDQDTYTAKEAKKIQGAVEGHPKADHFHIVLLRKSFATIAQIAQAFGVPPNQVEPKPPSAFLDLVEYLTHENPNQVNQGKHVYDDSEVTANFDWRPELDEHKQNRAAGGKGNKDKKTVDQWVERIAEGEATLKGIRTEAQAGKQLALYNRNRTLLKDARSDYLLHQSPPRRRTNYYICGVKGNARKGRTGKTQLARLFARSLFRDFDADECYHEAKDKRVPLQTYKGQPVIIWDDYSPVDLMDALGGRTGVWQVFDDHPGADDVNIKYGSVRLIHEVNIITRVTPYQDFLDGLAGTFTDRSGVQHKAEDPNQAWGRFPMVFEVTQDSISLLVNQGFIDDTDDFRAFKKVATMQTSMKQVMSALDSVEDDEEREAARALVGERLLAPMLQQHAALQPNPSRTAQDVLGELLPSIAVITGDDLAAFESAQEAQNKAALDARIEAAKAAAAESSGVPADDLIRFRSLPPTVMEGWMTPHSFPY